MLVNGSNFTTIWIESDNQKVKIIDQRLLPHELKVVTLNTVNDVEFAIREMQVRGAPLIGVAAAFGMYIAALENPSLEHLSKSADLLRCSNEGFSNAAMYIPKAAATPIKGAPLTCISLIANSTSLTVFNVTTFNS